MKNIIVSLILLLPFLVVAQAPKLILSSCFKKFDRIKSYKAKVHLDFKLPDINMKSRDAKVYYKKPNKFKIKSQGILFLPKQNPYESFDLLRDTTLYTAVFVNEEVLQKNVCKVILVVPIKQEDIILCKLWIDDRNQLIYRMRITTKSSGTVLADYFYGQHINSGLPDKSIYEIEMSKFKIPKAIALELNNKKTEKSTVNSNTGTIQMIFSEYQINVPVTEI